jgi:surfeit locus 1 family protein
VSLKTLKARFLLVTIASLIGVAVTARLGFWQLSRATEKLAAQAAIQHQTALPPLDASALLSPKDLTASLHRSVQISGTWLSQHTIYLDNRQMDGKPGFFILTPFEFEDKTRGLKKTILVQRGWVVRNFIDRQRLPQTAAPQGVVALYGRIALPPSKLYEFKGVEAGQIRQNVDLRELAQEFNIELLNASLLQLDDPNVVVSALKTNDELIRRWPLPNASVEKNYGYMVQWWALSALIAILYVWFQLIRPQLRSAKPQKNND